MPIIAKSLIVATLLWLPNANGSMSPYRRRERLHLDNSHLHHRRQQWRQRAIPSFFRGIVRGGGIVAVAPDVAAADACGGDSSKEASLGIIDDGPSAVNERVAHLPATDANIHNDTNYNNDGDLAEGDEELASTTTTSATTNTDATTPISTTQYVTKKDGTIELFDEDKVSKGSHGMTDDLDLRHANNFS